MKRDNSSSARYDLEEATPWPVRVEERLAQAFRRISLLEEQMEVVEEHLKKARSSRKAARS